nr:MAG TPA: protein of unknown function (DUF1816) [Caudoviricetes sp.]
MLNAQIFGVFGFVRVSINGYFMRFLKTYYFGPW